MAVGTDGGTPRALLAALSEALSAGQRLDADVLVGRLLAARAPLGGQWRALARLSRHNGALDHARRAISLHVEQANGAPAARFEEAALLAEIGDLTGAEAALDRLPADFPDQATRAHFLGTIALNRGDAATARARFSEALATRAGSGVTWLALADANRGLPAGEWAPAVIGAAPSFVRAGAVDRAAYAYALGAARDALGETNAAFTAFDEGAELVRVARPHNDAADRAAVVLAMQPATITARPSVDTTRPIFVFGTPRSGTTLVEQILTSHSAVADGGEVQLLDLVADRIGGLSGATLDRAAAAIGLDALANDYLALIAARFGTNGRIVDKTLTTQRYLALIPTILPDAPLVWVRRDPLDTAWSCFRTLFAQGLAWSFDQAAIARHMLLDDRLLAFWRDRLGGKLLVIDYQALVRDKDTEIPRLLGHCGLAPELATLEPHLASRAVVTASVSQVRAPINTGAIGSAAPYRRHLQPFIDAYVAGGGRID